MIPASFLFRDIYRSRWIEPAAQSTPPAKGGTGAVERPRRFALLALVAAGLGLSRSIRQVAVPSRRDGTHIPRR
jgi:hypothetical protein